MVKLRAPADSNRVAHCYYREFGTSRTGSTSSRLHETIAPWEVVPGIQRHFSATQQTVAWGAYAFSLSPRFAYDRASLMSSMLSLLPYPSATSRSKGMPVRPDITMQRL